MFGRAASANATRFKNAERGMDRDRAQRQAVSQDEAAGLPGSLYWRLKEVRSIRWMAEVSTPSAEAT